MVAREERLYPNHAPSHPVAPDREPRFRDRLTRDDTIPSLAPPPTSQALALFGFGGDPVAEYTQKTTEVIEQVRFTLDLPTDSPDKAAAIEKTRKLTNAWVAKYRRDKAITGRPSYGNVYSALNAVSGHYNNFGTKYPLPVKRKERVLQEFATAELALSRGR